MMCQKRWLVAGAFVLSLSMIGWGWAQDGQTTTDGNTDANAAADNAISIQNIQHFEQPMAEWWNFEGIALQQANGPEGVIEGNGRLFLASKAQPFGVQAGAMHVALKPHSVAFIDQVGGQVRIMLMSGHAIVNDGFRQMELKPSLQAVLSPEPNDGYFIDDGVYRRPVLKRFDDTGRSTLIRQFYMEQVIYTDPLLRTLYANDTHAKRLINSLNKKGAILRDINGTWGYEEGQV